MNKILAALAVVSLLGFGFVATSPGAEPMAKGGFTTYDTLQLIGMEVKNPQGEVLGAISDFVFARDGRIIFAILCHDCYADSPMAKDVAVPLSAFTISGMKGSDLKVVLNIDAQKLAAAPAYHWGKGGPDRQWAADVYRYYGLQPFWEEREPY